MFYLDTADQMSYIITVCFSFCIFVFTLWFKNADIFPRQLGFAFMTPFLSCAAAFLVQNRTVSDSLLAIAEPALLLLLFVLLISKPENKNFNSFKFILFTTPFAIILLCSCSPSFRNYFSVPLNNLPPVIILVILNMFILKKEKGRKGLLFWIMLPIAAYPVLGALLKEGIIAYAVPALKFVSYIMFSSYFYDEYVRKLTVKVAEAEKRISAVNRSLDFEVKKRILELERINENLVSISKIDALSKIYNKAAVVDAILEIIQTKPKNEFSILMFDIDNFKFINDTMGHITGDKCIKMLSAAAKSNLRDFDIIGRYGGDEFIIALPGTNTMQAIQIAERLRKKIETTDAPHYTISIGIATYPYDGITVKELIKVADEGLYKSKSKGRNAVSHTKDY